MQTQTGAFSGGDAPTHLEASSNAAFEVNQDPEGARIRISKNEKNSIHGFYVGRISKRRAVVRAWGGAVSDRVGQETQMCIQQHPVLLSLSVFLARCFCHLREQNSHSVFLQDFSVQLALERLPTQTSRSERDLLGVKQWRAQKKTRKKRSRCFRKMSKAAISLHFGFSTRLLKDFEPLWEWQLEFFWQHLPPFLPYSPTPHPHSQHITKWRVRECKACTAVWEAGVD